MSVLRVRTPERRSFLQTGALSLAGVGAVGLADLQASTAEESTQGGPARARSVIFVFLGGGLSQLDSFDMKPGAPVEIRGQFQPIATSTPGVQVCEHLPQLAQRSELWSQCRSVTHRETSHGPACHSMLTGRTILPPGSPTGCGAPPAPGDWPGIATLVNLTVRTSNDLPAAFVIPPRLNNATERPGTRGGRMGPGADPWVLQPCRCTGYGCCPDCFGWKVEENGANLVVPHTHDQFPLFQTPDFTLPPEVPQSRFARRLDLLSELDKRKAVLDRSGSDHLRNQARAVSLLKTDASRSALFDVTNADDAIQDRYGRNEWGWTLLLSRRLVEAGVPFVQVALGKNGCWDTHRDNFRLLKNDLFPPFDRALSALLDDLHERGLLHETLVVIAGEFGRSPRITREDRKLSEPGRAHWAAVQTVLFAGGGVAGGRVIGRSDSIGGAPDDVPQTPENLAATMYEALGVPRSATWYEKDDAVAQINPQPVYNGEPIPGLTE